ncbi:MAG: tetratricopeptide repeat protein [Acidobacteriota bacterium]
MDTQTRHALKQDKFRQATAESVSWLSENRSNVTRWVITGAVVVVLLVAGLVYWNVSSSAAETALGAGLDIYAAPLATPGAPPQPDTYATASERSKAANDKFVAVANKYGWLPVGAKAEYFAGVTYQELGQNGSAETELKKAAGSWNRNIANLAKVALAGLYHQTGRDPEAIALYNEIGAKPSTTVPAAVAQLDLADLYAAQGKQNEAKILWAKVRDTDKDGMAGSIAAQKLSGK